MPDFSALNRTLLLEEMASRRLDVLVIGGGITGVGIAWDAARRGMDTGLLEMNDFAAGTSSRSTKLVHGGLRYLKQGEIGLVREVGRERTLLARHAPHLVIPEPLLLPLYKKGSMGYWTASLGLYIYDRLAGVAKPERRVMLGREETLRLEPLLAPEGLLGSGFYYEYRTDDARLTVEIAKTAARNGAKLVNYAPAVRFLYENGRVAGVVAVDRFSGKEYAVYAKTVISAAGPWADRVREMERADRRREGVADADGRLLTSRASGEQKRLLLTKGVHLVVDRSRLPIRQAVYFDVPDGRMVFVIPREGKTYIGTTDTVYEGDLEDPRTTAADRDYLLAAANRIFPSVRLTAADVESVWAGLRPLIHEEGKKPSEVSRKDEIFVSPTGLITIAGGKLTGFRKMAEKAVDLAAHVLRQEDAAEFPPCSTDREIISGGEGGTGESYDRFRQTLIEQGVRLGVPPETAAAWFSRYGSNIREIYREYARLSEETDCRSGGDAADHDLVANTAERALQAEIAYCIDHEMTATAADFLVRRTGLVFFHRQKAERLADAVLRLMGDRLGWDEHRREEERAGLQQAFAAADVAP